MPYDTYRKKYLWAGRKRRARRSTDTVNSKRVGKGKECGIGQGVNVYSTNDYIPAFLYRVSSIQCGTASLQKVEGVKGVENVDASGLVSGHTRYRYLTGSILKKIGFEDIDMEEVARKEAEL